MRQREEGSDETPKSTGGISSLRPIPQTLLLDSLIGNVGRFSTANGGSRKTTSGTSPTANAANQSTM